MLIRFTNVRCSRGFCFVYCQAFCFERSAGFLHCILKDNTAKTQLFQTLRFVLASDTLFVTIFKIFVAKYSITGLIQSLPS